MKKNLLWGSVLILSVMSFNDAIAQEFFEGTKTPTATVSRSGITNFGFAQFRNNASIGAFVFERSNSNGDMYFRSSVLGTDRPGNLIINDNAGFVGIGTPVPKEKLSVNGNIRAREIKVEIANWPDYVFHTDYNLRSLQDVKRFIQDKGHLPEVPTAGQVAQDGISVGEVNSTLLKKVEELTLYIIQLEERIHKLEENK
ncbi:hypothetical protein HP439_12355 [Sphingobacterium shayense]|uniref:hypothetical protein n=1 Tax=Sphingobacterium shayense TaxID=626343 RepID=UPI001556BFA1|nr:hypothetical protein [Sphingobacterium shayense]NQD71516.1 hypothetical protein [Sphingobacterium shayense]